MIEYKTYIEELIQPSRKRLLIQHGYEGELWCYKHELKIS